MNPRRSVFIASLIALLTVIFGTAAGWPTDHGDDQRSGYDPTNTPYRSLSIAFNRTLDGAVYGSPVLAGNLLVVATENDSVYGLDPATGVVRWYRHLRAPVSNTTVLACSGNIRPTGITGSPAYDPATGRIFVVTVTDSPSLGVEHELWGLSAGTGATVVNRRVEVPGTDPKAEQQRAALAVDSGNVYIAFGGLAGDCGNYKGAVISLYANGQPGGVAYVVPTGREAGMWAPGGPVIAPDHTVYMSAGNGESTSGAYDYSDSVTRLTPRMSRLDFFAPTNWAAENAADLDLGSMTPVWLSNGLLLQAGKAGQAYTMRASHLGGIGGQLAKTSLCSSCGAYGVAAVTGSTAYIPTTAGIKRVDVSSNGQMVIDWTAGGISGSPVAGRGALYALGGDGNLYALSGHNGSQFGHIAVGATSRFATPAISGNKLYVPTLKGVTAVLVG